ncbi:MAG: hypothetical protein M1834_005842 [Cirrosporium novae-zelandiae]|nr:MAG: hypothetical protein M1834_005842 [Cirrosporium novae-zelandiae]
MAGGGMSPAGSDVGNNVGVMRFLQTEWHRHERDRNAWEIERAEMKSRIGRLEGEARMGKRLQESQGKLVKILEQALKREREKVKSLSSPNGKLEGEKANVTAEKDFDKVHIKRERLRSLKNRFKIIYSSKSAPPPKPQNSFLDTTTDPEENEQNQQEENDRDKSKSYLGKFNQEFFYHMIPPAQPFIPPDEQQEEPPNHLYPNEHPQPTLEDVYLHQRQQKPYLNNVSMTREPSLQNHLAPIPPSGSNHIDMSRQNEQLQPPTSMMMTRDFPDQQLQNQVEPITAIDHRKQTPLDMPPSHEDQVEHVTHAFDAYGREIPSRENAENMRMSEAVDGTDGWDFSEPIITNEQPPEYAAPQRPDTDAFPPASTIPPKSPPRPSPGSHRRKSSGARRRSEVPQSVREGSTNAVKSDSSSFKVRFALRGHLDVVRSVIFTGGGSPSEPEICTAGDDGVIKRWVIPANYGNFGAHGGSVNDLDVTSYFTHRGHTGSVTSLAACPASQNFSNGGRALGDGWVFSGGQDATVKVWERGRVDPKATLDGHTDAVWALCVLPGTSASVFGDDCSHYGGAERILLASGAADGTILIWAVSPPPQLTSPQTSGRRGAGGGRRSNSVSSGSNFPSSPQPSTASSTPFNYALVHRIQRTGESSPTCISPLSLRGDTFVASFTDASVLIFDTRTGEEVVGMASLETYDGTPTTGVNCVVATTVGLESSMALDSGRGLSEDDSMVHGATGSSGGVEGVVISGHEDRFIRFFDANSGQCTYTMLAHPAAIASLSLSPDGRELVSAGHDASLRFWSLEKRSCTQEITSHRLMRGEGVCAVVWSQDGRWVVSGGGDGVVKVFSR